MVWVLRVGEFWCLWWVLCLVICWLGALIAVLGVLIVFVIFCFGEVLRSCYLVLGFLGLGFAS